MTGDLEKGIFVLCFDVELAWGGVHRKINLDKLTRIINKVRHIMNPLTQMLEKYEIPATWSILGHLVLDHCERVNGKPHPEMPRANYSWLKADWYRYDPCSNIEDAPHWYGKDVIDRIVSYVENSKLSHDIACHSFSHQMFGDPGCSREVAEAEVKKCVEIMKREYGIVLKVFTFPRDYIGHVDVLKESGFVAFRDTIPKLYPCLEMRRTFSNVMKTTFSLLVQGISYYVISSPHVVKPKSVQGVWSIPGSLGYSKKAWIPFKLVTFKAIRGIRESVREKKIFCLNTHLIDLASTENAFCGLDTILSYVDREREEGHLLTQTIKDVALGLKAIGKA